MGGNGGQSFYRRDEQSVGKGSDPKIGSVSCFGWFGFSLAAHTAVLVLYLHTFFSPVTFDVIKRTSEPVIVPRS